MPIRNRDKRHDSCENSIICHLNCEEKAVIKETVFLDGQGLLFLVLFGGRLKDGRDSLLKSVFVLRRLSDTREVYSPFLACVSLNYVGSTTTRQKNVENVFANRREKGHNFSVLQIV